MILVYATAREMHGMAENETGTKKPLASALLPLRSKSHLPRKMQMKLRLWSAHCFMNDQSQEHFGSTEIALWIKCLYKHEDFNSGPQQPCNKPSMAVYAYDPTLGMHR